MTVPFTHPELVWPELAARIRRAHAVYAPGVSPGPDPTALERTIGAALDAARAGDDPALSRVPGLADPSARSAFDAAFRTADLLFGAAGLAVPDADDFALAGLDLTLLGAEWAASRSEGQGPVAPLTPVIAPHGLGSEWWLARFATLRGNAEIPDNPLRASGDGDGLALAPDVLAGFRAFDTAPAGTRSGRVPVVPMPGAGTREVEWTLRLVPSGAKPVHVNLNHRAGGAEHPTLPEMLALQAGRILHGEPPVDQGVFTWLAGTIDEGRIAARAVWDASLGVVRVSCREIGNQGSYLGVRPPVSSRRDEIGSARDGRRLGPDARGGVPGRWES